MTLKELRDKEKQIQRDLDEGINEDAAEMTLNELFDLYMKTKTGIRQSTRAVYFSLWENCVKTGIGEMKIKNIKAADIRVMYAEFTERGLCEGTIRGVHHLINATLEMAVDSDMIRKNPAKNCGKYIVGGKHERKALTREEEREFLNFIENSNIYRVYAPLFEFLLNTGLRVSEMCGLRWADVDMKKNMIHVRQQLTYCNYGDGCKYHVSDLKTENAERDIPLTKDARKALNSQRELDLVRGIQRQEVERISDFVFVNSKGRPWAVGAINAKLDQISKRHNLNTDLPPLPHISAHLLRHTFASRLAEGGLDVKGIQTLLGHADASTTLNVYIDEDAREIERKFHETEDAMKVI